MGGKFETLRLEYQDILRKSYKTKDTELIETKIRMFAKTTTDIKSPLDQAFRDLLLELLEQEVDVVVLREFVDFNVIACRKELSNPTMPVVLLSDIFDTLTLDLCQEMFQYVENNVETWKECLFFSCCKNNLLRLCNDLLRRLSRSTATVFCGRILLFLAKFFPFSERSGLNIVSEFNLENTTEYGTDLPQENTADLDNDDNKKNTIIDYTFYCKFWSLQDFFRNPNQLYGRNQWKLFCSYANSVLSTFHGLKLEHIENHCNYHEIKEKIYFSKYLTSQKLLDLQLYDVNFRRAVLLQFLILFQYLSSSVKFKSDSFELKADQKDWIQQSSEKVYNLLKETPPDGGKFAEIAANILIREEHWNAWKNDGCPELKKTAITVESSDKRKEERPLLGDLIKDASIQNKYYMGTAELTKLWNLCPDNLEACKGKDRNFLPTLEDYFADAINQLETTTTPQQPLKDDENLLKDGNFGWRALRLLAKRSPHFFTYSNVIMNPLSSYLEMMVRKIAHDRPGRNLHEKEENQQQLENEEENLFKDTQVDDNTEDIKSEFIDDRNTRIEHKIMANQLELFSEKIVSDWKKLATKFGFKSDEIQFFVQEHSNEVDQAKSMLQLWFDDDEDATLENFLYILEGLEMEEAAEAVRNEINTMET